jgi:integrase
MTDRHDLLASIRTFTIGNVTVDGPEDLSHFLKLLDSDPRNGEALREQLRGDVLGGHAQMMLERIERILRSDQLDAPSAASIATAASNATPPNPVSLSVALSRFAEAKRGANSARTLRDKGRLFESFRAHLTAAHPRLGPDPFVHEIGTHHLSAFLDSVSMLKPNLKVQGDLKPAAAKTMIKKIAELRSLFEYLHDELNASNTEPTLGLAKRLQEYNKAASADEQHRDPFETDHLVRIFEPKSYLAANRAADYFWAPLLGLHLGTRLKEVVTLKLANVQRHVETGILFIDITPENAKNRNSIRRLPIPERLIEVGFSEYVDHVRRLGATALFPHRDLSGSTARNDPSKNCSRAFGNYLDQLDIRSEKLVFHSFRHTVVTALQDCGTPLLDSMQITGHQAQDHAVKTGMLSEQQARSVHLKTYTHADKARLNVEYPLSRLKDHLDRSIDVPLDYSTLAKAAAIVLEHTRKDAEGFHSGWKQQRMDYTEAQLERL